MLAWAHRYGWKQSKAAACKTQSQVNTPSNALSKAISDHKTRSTLALGQYTAEAAESAAKATDKLAIAKRVRDVASVHSTLWPHETHTEIFSLGVLTGALPVRDLPAEQ